MNPPLAFQSFTRSARNARLFMGASVQLNRHARKTGTWQTVTDLPSFECLQERIEAFGKRTPDVRSR